MSWQLFDRIRSYFRDVNLYGHENLLQNQDDLTRITQGNEFINYSTTGIINQTNLQINRMERYKDFSQMDDMGEISLSLDLYADESTQIDPERKTALAVRAKDKRVKEELEHLFHDTLLIDNKLRPMARYLCKYGDLPLEIVPTRNRDAVASFRPVNIYNFLRVETRFGDLVGFFFVEPSIGSPIFLHPWQCVHMRLATFENIYQPYGRSILDGARKDFKRLRLMEDAALIYRITRAPEKRLFTIPVGNIPTHEVEDYLNQIADQFKRHRFFDPASGEVNWRYLPLIQEDDFWLPQRADGTGPTIDTLAGAENLDQIADIEYFKKKMIAALKIPYDRVGMSGEKGEGSDKSLSSSSPEFAKAVQWIQREMVMGLKKIALVHLAMKGYGVEDMKNFDLNLTASSAIDELYRIETWSSRTAVIAQLKDTGLFPDEWLVRSFTDLTDDEIAEMQAQKSLEAPTEVAEELPALESLGNLDTDLARRVIAEYNEHVDRRKLNLENLVQRRVMRENRYRNIFDVMVTSNELNGLDLQQNRTQSGGDGDPFLLTEDTDVSAAVEMGDDEIIRASFCDDDLADEAIEAKQETMEFLKEPGRVLNLDTEANEMVLPESS